MTTPSDPRTRGVPASRRRPGSAAGRSAGFTLVEALVALAVLALALLLGLGLIFQQKRTLLRLDARAEAEAALAEAHERLRAGAHPLVSGPVPVTLAADAAEELSVVVLIHLAEPPADLYRGRFVVRYRVAGERHARALETMFWRPGLVKTMFWRPGLVKTP